MTQKRSIITIAVGKKLYLDFAANLARSFFWHHPDTEIEFYIVTDKEDLFENDILKRVKFINIKVGELGEGFSSKLYLDKLAPSGQTLFIDSDCLIFGNLETVFEKFRGNAVSVVGGYISSGEWFGDVASICKKFNVQCYPKFNGGVYYLETGYTASAVYETARKLEKEYDKIGFIRLRNNPNDEVIMGLAMQLHNQKPIPEDSTIMSDPQSCPGGYKINVITGDRWLLNPPFPHPCHQEWFKFEKVTPLIFHFLGYYTNHYPYRREAYRLKQAINNKLTWDIELKAKLLFEYPERIRNLFKKLFRPIFRLLVGVRKIKQSERI